MEKAGKTGKILFKLGQTLHIPSCMLLCLLVSFSLYGHGTGGWEAVFYAMAFTLAAMGCFALNDYYDYEKDRVNKPYRILPLGLIQKETLLKVGYALFFFAILLSAAVSKNRYEFGMYIFVITAAFLYSRFIDCLGKVKCLYTAVVLSIPMLFTIYKCRINVNLLLLFVAVILYISGKELLMDIYDLEGDAQAGQRTLPVLYGERITFVAAVAVQMGSMVFFLLLQKISHYIIVPCCFLLCICYYIWSYNVRVWRRFTIYCLWIPFVVCLVSIVRM